MEDVETIMRLTAHYAEAVATLHRYESERYRDDERAAQWRRIVARREADVRAALGGGVTADYWARRADEHRQHARELRERAAGTDDADERDELERSAIDADLSVECCDRNDRLYDHESPAPSASDLDGTAVAAVLERTTGAPGLPASTWQTYLDQGKRAASSWRA